MYMNILLVVSCLAVTVLAECRDLKVKQEFHIEKFFVDVWYQQAQYIKPENVALYTCVNFTYNYNSENLNYDVIIEQRRKFVRRRLTSVGTLGYASDQSKVMEEGKLTLSLEQPRHYVKRNSPKVTEKPLLGGTIDSPLHVLGTDYEYWAVVYSCKSVLGDFRVNIAQGVYIWMRRAQYWAGGWVLETINPKIDAILTANGLHRRDFQKTDQTHC